MQTEANGCRRRHSVDYGGTCGTPCGTFQHGHCLLSRVAGSEQWPCLLLPLVADRPPTFLARVTFGRGTFSKDCCDGLTHVVFTSSTTSLRSSALSQQVLSVTLQPCLVPHSQFIVPPPDGWCVVLASIQSSTASCVCPSLSS